MYSIIFSDPFSQKTEEKEFDGISLYDAVATRYPMASRDYTISYIGNGGVTPVKKDIACRLTPKSGKYIAYVTPKDSDTARLALTIALVAAGQYYVVGAGGLGLTGTAASIASFAVTAGSVYLSQKIIPFETPSTPNNGTESSTFSISGSSNSITTGAVPYLIGTHKIYPPKAMQPVTEAEGKDVFLTEVFCAGFGPLNIDESTLKIGDTLITNFSDVEVQIKDNLSYTAPIDLVSGDTFSESVSASFSNALDEAIRTTQTDCEEIVVEIAFPALVSYNSEGKKISTSCSYDVLFSETGAEDYISLQGTTSNEQNLTFTTTSTQLYLYSNATFGSRDKSVKYGIESYITFNDGLPAGYVVGTEFTVRDSIKNNRTFTIQSIDGNTVKVGDYVVGGVIQTDASENFDKYRQDFTQTGTQCQAESGTSATIFDGTGSDVSFTATDSTTTTTYRTHKINVPKGQYDVKVVRQSEAPSDTRTQNSFTWTQLKSVQYTDDNGDPIEVFPDQLCYVALKIKATDQLNGAISNLNFVASSVCNSYNTVTDQFNNDDQSGNPAWEYFKLLTSSASKKTLSPSEIEITDFQEWADLCNEEVLSTSGDLEPRFRVNLFVDYNTTAGDLMKKIGTIGRAARRRVDYKEGILVDKADKQSVINLSPANILSMTWSKSFARKADAYKVKFANADEDYAVTELLVKKDNSVDEQDLQFIEDLDGTGITDPDQAYRFGKYAHAQLELRPEDYELKLGVNYLTFLRGDVITLTHDRIQGVTCFGQVLANAGLVVTVDNPFNISNAQLPLYATFSNPESQSQAVATYEITDITDNEITFASLPAFDLVDAYYSIGSSVNSITRQYLVTDIKTADEMTATVALTDYGSPTIFEAEDSVSNYVAGNVPLVINQSTPPSIPVVTSTITDERALLVNSDGSIETRAEFILDRDSIDQNKPQPSFVQVLWRISAADGAWERFSYPLEADIYANNLLDGIEYDFKIRYISEFGIAGDWVYINDVLVEGKTNKPASVTGFNYEIQEGSILLYWDKNEEVDVRKYEIKVGADWDTGVVVDSINAIEKRLELLAAGTYNYMIKAVDVIGLESETETSLSVVMPVPADVSSGSFSIIEDGYRVYWDGSSNLNFAQFEIREGDLWNSATVIDQLKVTSIKFPVRTSGTYRYLVKQIDTVGNYSENALAIDVVIANPVSVQGFSYTQEKDGLLFEWDQNTNLWHSQYEIRRGARWESGVKVDILKTNTKKINVLVEGSYQYMIKSIDLAGNYSDESAVTATVNLPSEVIGISAETIDNNINLRWTEPLSGFRIDYYKVYKQNTSTSGGLEDLGYTYTTFFTRFESDAGIYRYYIEPVDIAGNVGPQSFLEVELDVPPDYVLVTDEKISLDLVSIVNGVKYSQAEVTIDSDRVTMDSTFYTMDSGLLTTVQYIIDSSVTFGDVMSTYNIPENLSSTLITMDNDIITMDTDSTTSMQDLVDSGINYWNQLAGGTTGSCEYTIDFGTVISSSNVRVTDVWDDLIGTVNKDYVISQSLDNVSFTDYTGKTKFMRDFRYVKIRINLTSDGNSLSTLIGLRAKLDLKKKYDGGSDEITDATNGKTVLFNQSFLDVNSITVTAKGTTAKYAIYDFNNAGDQTFFTAYLFDTSGVKTTGEFSWAAEGF